MNSTQGELEKAALGSTLLRWTIAVARSALAWGLPEVVCLTCPEFRASTTLPVLFIVLWPQMQQHFAKLRGRCQAHAGLDKWVFLARSLKKSHVSHQPEREAMVTVLDHGFDNQKISENIIDGKRLEMTLQATALPTETLLKTKCN